MSWLKNLSIRIKVLSIALLGIAMFLAYFGYTYMVSDRNISELSEIESIDFVVLEASAQNNLTLYMVRDAFIRAINNGDEDALSEAVRLSGQALDNLYAIAEVDPTIASEVARLTDTFSAYIDEAQILAERALAGQTADESFYTDLANVARLRDEFEMAQDDFQEARYTAFYDGLRSTREQTASTQLIGLIAGGVAVLLLALISFFVIRSITRPIQYAVEVSGDIAEGDWDTAIDVGGRDEAGRLLEAIRRMRDALKTRRDEDRRQEQLKSRLADLNDRMRGDMTLHQLGENMLNYLVPTLDGQIGAFYCLDEDGETLRMSSSYAMERRKHIGSEFTLGESLVGQCALEKKQILLTRVPEDYMTIASAVGTATARNVLVTPIVHEDELKGVIELGAFRDFTDDDLKFLSDSVRVVAVAVHTAQSRVRLAGALEQAEKAAEQLEKQKEDIQRVNEDLENQAMELAASESRLQQQQEELRAINEELESQTQALRASEESLQAQQEELRVTNEELEAQARLLSEQKAEVSSKNKVLEDLQLELEEKIRELEMSSKYKSEFLSTMSHELRTPLNSILILSSALAQNKKGNLEEKQIEHAQVIHSAGSDLLTLINDILDISKIEEGKMDIVIDDISVPELGEHFRKHFTHLAESRGLRFEVELGDGVPEHLYTDRQRMEQIIKNLLSNAMKFTDSGGLVKLRIDAPSKQKELPTQSLIPGQTLRLSVIDSGIGIAPEKQRLVFEAFQQADGTTSRKYGGTGLGLTISRELARLLGGDIGLFSEGVGTGTTFMLFLPFGEADHVYQEGGEEQSPATIAKAASVFAQTTAEAGQEQEGFVIREKTVLIIEDDKDFAGVLVDLASDYGLEAHVCEDGETGLEYASHYRPSAIILDIGLPGIDGWQVMEKLKADPRTKDIPVHFLSGKDEKKKALELGAIDFLTKPISEDNIIKAFGKIEKAIEKNVRRLLVVEDSELQHEGIRELFSEKGVAITAVHTGEEALEMLRTQVHDCMILDLTLPDMNGFELLEEIHDNNEYDSLPVIIYTGKELTRDEEGKLRKYADRIILKTERSSERLLNEASLFLHWLESTMPAREKTANAMVEHRDDVFTDKKLLLVDDDMRNIYALSAQLEELGFDITIANNGKEAVDTLNANPEMDIVLMDIMMPEMDGYEAMTLIRKQSRFQKLPILALTAKAMKDDKAKCLEAGANDYCSKPIDMAKLTSLMRVWLHK